jgi:predicted AlkP superfamily pyrophosphatase or phosphodiesterase
VNNESYKSPIPVLKSVWKFNERIKKLWELIEQAQKAAAESSSGTLLLPFSLHSPTAH